MTSSLADHVHSRQLEAKSNQPIRVIVDFEGQFISTQFGLLDWHLALITDSNEGTGDPVNVLVQLQVDGTAREMLSGGSPQSAAPSEPVLRKRRKMSAAARRRIAAAQRARWAKARGESKPAAPAATKATKPKRRISPEGLKRIIAATKKRWRLQRAAKPKKAA